MHSPNDTAHAESAPAAEAAPATGATSARIGDFLLTFGFEGASFPTRAATGPWDARHVQSGWTLWINPTVSSGTWKGSPWRTIDTDGWHLYLLGELYGIPGGAAGLDRTLIGVARGDLRAQDLNGHFLLCGRHDVSRTWHLWTNRFGTLHAYYACNGGRAAVGTFFPAVAAAASRRQLDWPGLAGFFALGFFPGARTFYDDVQILRPASHYVWSSDGVLRLHERYWDWWHRPDHRRSYTETIEEFARIFEAAVAGQVQSDRIALPLSGGLDSRSALAVAARDAGRNRLWCYSYGYSPDSSETRIARRLAEARGVPFDAFTIEPYLDERLDVVLASVEGFQDLTQCRQAGVASEIASRADYLIAAHWGDVWLDEAGAARLGRTSRDVSELLDVVLQKMVKPAGAWLLEHLCRERLGGSRPEELVRELLRAELGRIPPMDDPDFRLKAFKTDQWSHRWTTASLRMFQPGAFPRLPFYDTRVAEFFCTVPTAFLSGRRLQLDYLKRHAADLAAIGWQVSDTSLFRSDWPVWVWTKRAAKKVHRIAGRTKVVERNWEIQLLDPRGRALLDRYLLRPGLPVHDLVAPAAVRRLVDDFDRQPLADGRGHSVPMLLTFAVWLERYG